MAALNFVGSYKSGPHSATADAAAAAQVAALAATVAPPVAATQNVILTLQDEMGTVGK